MKFLIVSHVPHKMIDTSLYAYEPYVREINLWLKYVDEVEIIAPNVIGKSLAIESVYKHQKIHFNAIPSISFISFRTIILSIFKLPVIIIKLIKTFRNADHIHLRCPGNIGLLGCIVQIFFPKKIKTAKYAGNWDPDASQPLSYKIQRKILKNTFFTKNATVLVYGEWMNQTENILPFFTASYQESEIEPWSPKSFDSKIHFIFAGTLSAGKRPLYAIKLVEQLTRLGKVCTLEVYGDGAQKKILCEYVKKQNLQSYVFIKGNVSKQELKKQLKKKHFLILPSKSEGWPKVVAEAMFWGVIPVVTKVSCIPWMLNQGTRGVLLTLNLENDAERIIELIANEKSVLKMSREASQWSRQYTLEKFSAEIKKLI